jgi:hypothetical protein
LNTTQTVDFTINTTKSISFWGVVSLYFTPAILGIFCTSLYFWGLYRKDARLKSVRIRTKPLPKTIFFSSQVLLLLIVGVQLWHSTNVTSLVKPLNISTCNDTCIYEAETHKTLENTAETISNLQIPLILFFVIVAASPTLSVQRKYYRCTFGSGFLVMCIAILLCLLSILQGLFCGHAQTQKCDQCDVFSENIHSLCSARIYDLHLSYLTILLASLLMLKKKKKVTYSTTLVVELPENKQFNNNRSKGQYVSTSFDKWYS